MTAHPTYANEYGAWRIAPTITPDADGDPVIRNGTWVGNRKMLDDYERVGLAPAFDALGIERVPEFLSNITCQTLEGDDAHYRIGGMHGCNFTWEWLWQKPRPRRASDAYVPARAVQVVRPEVGFLGGLPFTVEKRVTMFARKDAMR